MSSHKLIPCIEWYFWRVKLFLLFIWAILQWTWSRVECPSSWIGQWLQRHLYVAWSWYWEDTWRVFECQQVFPWYWSWFIKSNVVLIFLHTVYFQELVRWLHWWFFRVIKKGIVSLKVIMTFWIKISFSLKLDLIN